MFPSSLDVADTPDEHGQQDYSPDAAEALTRAYAHIKDGVAPYAVAKQLLELHLANPMSNRQRMRAHYLLGSSLLHADRPRDAIPELDEALDRAAQLDDTGAFAVLAEQQAFTHYVLQSSASAAAYYADALDAIGCLDDSMSRHPAQISTFKLDLLWGLSTQQFLLADYTDAHLTINQAHHTASTLDIPTHRLGTLYWTEALLHRWQGHGEQALRCASTALYLYESYGFGSAAERARLHVVAAECALDLTAQQPFDRLIDIAAGHAERELMHALAQAPLVDDQAGEALALLAYARYNRMTRRPQDRMAILLKVESLAYELRDRALLCQTYTVLGDELLDRNEHEPALNCYRRALDILAPHDAAALGMWARQALFRAAE